MFTLINTKNISWCNLFVSGFVATTIVTATMMISGTNILQALGAMLVGSNAPGSLQYAAGGFAHLATGLVYAFLYVLLFATITEWGRLTKGIIFGIVTTTMALTLMPVMASMVSGESLTANPCAPMVHNPCVSNNTRSSYNPCAMNKHNPRQAKVANPCNPCAMKSTNPCAHLPQKSSSYQTLQMTTPQSSRVVKTSNPCMPSNPCASGSSTGNVYAGAVSLINHIIFGLTLAFFVRIPAKVE